MLAKDEPSKQNWIFEPSKGDRANIRDAGDLVAEVLLR